MSKKPKDRYEELGVSSTKEDVHKATKNLDKGMFPGAFCKILPFRIGGLDICQVFHADGAGTKSNVAYLMKEEKHPNHHKFFSSVAQDAAVMNTDDMAAVGIVDNITFINVIERNATRVSGLEVGSIIQGYVGFFNMLKQYGIQINEAGGETADVGSYTTTMGLIAAAIGYIEKGKVIDCSNIKPDSYIVGLSSSGQCSYETIYNSGIRSNGLTLAINCMLHPDYRKYKEAWDSALDPKIVFRGKYHLEDNLPGTPLTVGEALLSPTRTYLPVLKKVFEDPTIKIDGIIHCSGGGLTKSLNFGCGIDYVIDNLFPIPPLFKAIQNSEDIRMDEMLSTFNMGVGMEIITDDPESAENIILAAKSFGVNAQIIGHTESNQWRNINNVIINQDGFWKWGKVF